MSFLLNGTPSTADSVVNDSTNTLDLVDSILELCISGEDSFTSEELLDEIRKLALEYYTRVQEDQSTKRDELTIFASGVLYDFLAFSTTRKDKLVLSSKDNSAPAVDTLKRFMKYKNVKLMSPDWEWYSYCHKYKK